MPINNKYPIRRESVMKKMILITCALIMAVLLAPVQAQTTGVKTEITIKYCDNFKHKERRECKKAFK